jgi:hypothetical protein
LKLGITIIANWIEELDPSLPYRRCLAPVLVHCINHTPALSRDAGGDQRN